jgi:hypothetical protein
LGAQHCGGRDKKHHPVAQGSGVVSEHMILLETGRATSRRSTI